MITNILLFPCSNSISDKEGLFTLIKSLMNGVFDVKQKRKKSKWSITRCKWKLRSGITIPSIFLNDVLRKKNYSKNEWSMQNLLFFTVKLYILFLREFQKYNLLKEI